MAGNNTEPTCCGNRDYWQYKNSKEEVIGRCCKNCGGEWLKGNILSSACSSDQQDFSLIDRDVFVKNNLIRPRINTAFQIKSTKTRITHQQFATDLKPGDHVTWQRTASYWHHGIVSKVDAETEEITTIAWTENETGQIGIFEKSERVPMDVGNSSFNQLNRVEYPAESSPELVLARARSRIGDTEYDLLYDNCESFATFCKTGSPLSHQVSWLEDKIRDVLLHSCARSATRILVGAVIAGEIAEEFVEHSKWPWWGSILISFGIVILFEIFGGIYDCYRITHDPQLRSNTTSDEDKCEGFVRRGCEGVFAVFFALLFSFLLDFFTGCLHPYAGPKFCSEYNVVVALTVVTSIFSTATVIICGVLAGYGAGKAFLRVRRRSLIGLGVLIGLLLGAIVGTIFSVVIGSFLNAGTLKVTILQVFVLAVSVIVGAFCGYMVGKRNKSECCTETHAWQCAIVGVLIGVLFIGPALGAIGGTISGVISSALKTWTSGTGTKVVGAILGVVYGLIGGMFAGFLAKVIGSWGGRSTYFGYAIGIPIVIVSGSLGCVLGLFFDQWYEAIVRKSVKVSVAVTIDIFLGTIGGITGGVLGRIIGTSCGSWAGRKTSGPVRAPVALERSNR